MIIKVFQITKELIRKSSCYGQRRLLRRSRLWSPPRSLTRSLPSVPPRPLARYLMRSLLRSLRDQLRGLDRWLRLFLSQWCSLCHDWTPLIFLNLLDLTPGSSLSWLHGDPNTIHLVVLPAVGFLDIWAIIHRLLTMNRPSDIFYGLLP